MFLKKKGSWREPHLSPKRGVLCFNTKVWRKKSKKSQTRYLLTQYSQTDLSRRGTLCDVRTVCSTMQINFSFLAMTWRRLLVAGFSPRKPGLNPGPVHEGLDIGFLRADWLFFVCVIPSMLYSHLHLNNTITRRTKGRRVEKFVQSNDFSHIASNGEKITFTLFLFKSPKG